MLLQLYIVYTLEMFYFSQHSEYEKRNRQGLDELLVL